MDEQRYFDSYKADGYYLSHHRRPGETALPQRPPSRGERAQKNCGSCYRPVPTPGYCTKCEASGAAERHRTAPARDHA